MREAEVTVASPQRYWASTMPAHRARTSGRGSTLVMIQRKAPSPRAAALIPLLLALLAVGYAVTRVSVTYAVVGGVLAAAVLALLAGFGLWVLDNTR